VVLVFLNFIYQPKILKSELPIAIGHPIAYVAIKNPYLFGTDKDDRFK